MLFDRPLPEVSAADPTATHTDRLPTMLFDRPLPEVLRTRAEISRDTTFFEMVDGPSVSYGEAYARAVAVANGLVALGVQRGACVVIMAENSVESIATWLGIHLAAGVEVAVNTAYRGQSLVHALENTRAEIMFIEERLLDRLAAVGDQLTHLATVVVYPDASGAATHRPALPNVALRDYAAVLGDAATPPERPVADGDLAAVVYTSGTTGPAKGVMMPHGQVSLFAKLGVEGARMTADDVHYCFVPLYHVAGKYMAIYGSMMTGGTVVLDTKFSAADWLPRVRAYNATMSHVHGPLVEMIYKQPATPHDRDNPVTRIVASPFPAKIAAAFEQRFALRGIETWGMTEVTVPVWQPFDKPLRVGCCGRVRDDYFDFRILDPVTDAELPPGEAGEFVLRPRRPWTIMQGYLHMPDATLAAWRNLWFHTGDHGYIDADGYVYFVDRGKERIRRRAENISSYDIEAAALSHPSVRECAVIGVASEFEGDDDVKLFVIPAAGADLPPEQLLAYLVGQLPHFMVPRYIAFVDQFSRTPTGKIQKAALRTAGADTWDRKAAGVALRDVSHPNPESL